MPTRPHPPRCPTCRKIRATHKAGITGRNEIAKALGISPASVTGHAKHAGITFDRAATKIAVEARAIDLRARRQKLIGDLYDLADQDVALLKADTYTYRVVYKESTEVVADVHAPSADRRNHSSAIATNLATAAKLEAVDGGSSAAEAHSVLDTLAAGFAAAAAGYTPTADDLDP